MRRILRIMSGIGTPRRRAYGDPTGGGMIGGGPTGGGHRRTAPAVAMLAILSCIAGLTAPSPAWADSQGTDSQRTDRQRTDAKAEARALADGARAGLEALAGAAPDNSTVPGYVGTAVPQTGYGPTLMADPATRPGDNASREAAAAMTSLPDRPELDPSKYTDAMAVMRDPKAHFDLDGFLSGAYADCDPHRMTAPSSSTERRCDAWRTTRNSTCRLDRRIDVEANVRYRCDGDSTRIHRTCERVLTKTCAHTGECSEAGRSGVGFTGQGGAFPLHHGDRIVTVGRRPFGCTVRGGKHSGGHWRDGSCTSRTRTVTTHIGNFGRLTQFRILRGGYTDTLFIKVNGRTVFAGNGPVRGTDFRYRSTPARGCSVRATSRDGPDEYVCDRPAQYYVGNEHGDRYYESRVLWASDGRHCDNRHGNLVPGIDLKPYLRPGANSIEMIQIAGACAYGFVELLVASRCCKRHHETWSETCD